MMFLNGVLEQMLSLCDVPSSPKFPIQHNRFSYPRAHAAGHSPPTAGEWNQRQQSCQKQQSECTKCRRNSLSKPLAWTMFVSTFTQELRAAAIQKEEIGSFGP